MFLQKLNVLNFKNCAEAELSFDPHINCFAGRNGAGKTNLLDAIHYLSLCKSYFNPIDSQQIRHETDFFMIQGVFDKNEKDEVVYCGLKPGRKKQFTRNKKEYSRLADHIGLFPLVMIAPYDISLVIEGSEERRKFIDNVISQTDNRYLDTLILYNKILLNRNKLLKAFQESGRPDEELLGIYNEQLSTAGMAIYEKRQVFLEVFKSYFDRHYRFISEEAEAVELSYVSQLHEMEYPQGLAANYRRDLALARSNFGIHKDELSFTIGGNPLKKFGSQGQQKSFLIALKLAQYSYLRELKKMPPLLLLDDIFDKLDERRIKKLMEVVSADGFGQLFITDTDGHRVERLFEGLGRSMTLFTVDRGSIVQAENKTEPTE